MSQLSEIWGATDSPKQEPEPIVEEKAEYTLLEDLLCVHQRIVAMQEILDEQIDTEVLRKHFMVSTVALQAIIGLNETWFQHRSGNRRRLVEVARQCRSLNVYKQTKMVIELERAVKNMKVTLEEGLDDGSE